MNHFESLSALAIVGPTATGKTDLALRLAEHVDMEIISMDSALIYRDMTIGTAKPSAEELAAVPHHLIDILPPTDSYSVSQFVQDTNRLAQDIHARGKLPVIVGGTMMYFNGLVQGIASLPQADATLRATLTSQWQQDPVAFHAKLAQVDPVTAQRFHANDMQRLTRAMEVYVLSGQAISTLQQQNNQRFQGQLNVVGLVPEDRALLHQRINQRFENMLNHGFEQEVQTLLKTYPLTLDMPSLRAVGYQQMAQYLWGECNRTQLIESAQAATRQLAKRQLTWLRKTILDKALDPFQWRQPNGEPDVGKNTQWLLEQTLLLLEQS